MKITINLPETFTINRSDVEVEVDMSTLPQGIVAQLVTHGLTQKVGDAAAGALKTTYEAKTGNKWDELTTEEKAAWKADNAEDVRETARGDMTKVMEQLAAGEWGVTRGGEGLSALDRKMVSMVRPQVKASDEKAYKNADEPARVQMCREYIERLSDVQTETLRKTAEARLERERKDAEELAALDLSIKV